MMAILDVPYTQVRVSLRSDGLNEVSDRYRGLNPRGQVPTLVDGEVVLWGSTAILVYLAGRYDPSGTWFPLQDSIALARIVQWLELAQNEIQFGLARARAVLRFGFDGDLTTAKRDGELALGILDRHLSGCDGWLVGEGPTIADVACYPYVALAAEGGLTLDGKIGIGRWLERIRSLPRYIDIPVQ